MSNDRMQISWDDLSTPAIEQKLKEQDAVAGTQTHYESNAVAVPQEARRLGWLYNAIVYLSLFGALGGLLGWGFGEVLHYRSNQQAKAQELIRQYDEIVASQKKKKDVTQAEIDKAVKVVVANGRNNPYFKIYIDPTTDDAKKAELTDIAMQSDQKRDFIANLIFYGISGVMIAMLLASADSLMERNINGTIVRGSIGAVVGLAGGLVVALLVNRIEQQMMPLQELQSFTNRMLTHAICWGLLGFFLAAAPGLILRNGKRLLIGVIGGVIGGVLGGLMFDPVEQWTGNVHISRLVAIVLVGLLTGLFSGIIENAIKTGWLKVEAGLIAGKQFVLYRDPTFIGSHPMSHIYLFNDPLIGKRHACVHIVGNGYEIEDLPLGTRTYVNGKPVTRQRLRNGDELRVGATVFKFQEKTKSA